MPRKSRAPHAATQRSTRSRVLKAVAVGMATAAVLAGCSTAGSGNAITYWYAPYFPGAKGVSEFLKYNITPFQKQYPKVNIQPVQKNVNTLDQQVQTALAAGQGPDLVNASGMATTVTYATAGQLADLTAYAKKENWSGTLLPWANEVSKVDGKVIALPQSYETLMVFYNKTLFQKYGWTPPKTRAQLETLANKMEAKGITPFAAGNSDYPDGTTWLVSAFLNDVAGPSKVYDALTGKTPWTDSSFADTMNLLKSYFDKGWFGGGVKQYFSTTDPEKYTDLATGKAGMYISGSWEFQSLPSYFKAAGSTFDWAPLPSLADGVPVTYPLSIGGVLSVNKATKNKAAAETYLNWNLKDTKTMWAQVATGADAMPVAIKASDIPSDVNPEIAREYLDLAKASESGNVGYTTWTSWGGEAEQYINDNSDKVLDGSLTTSAFLNGLEAAYKDDVKKGNLPTIYKTGKSIGQ